MNRHASDSCAFRRSCDLAVFNLDIVITGSEDRIAENRSLHCHATIPFAESKDRTLKTEQRMFQLLLFVLHDVVEVGVNVFLGELHRLGLPGFRQGLTTPVNLGW